MPVYSVNRRRAIILLILSSVLLLTLDLRGNPLIDRARSAFATILSPFDTAGRVIANPIRNAWHGATDYAELQRENDALRDQLAQQMGDDLAARAIYGDYQELLSQAGLTTRYPTVTARVVGGAPGNFEQTIEVDRGSDDGIQVGMAVVNQGGLVGKITKVYSNRSVVLLVTDADYAIECKVSGTDPAATPAGTATDAAGSTTTVNGTDASTTTVNTTPSGVPVADLSTTTTSTAPATTTTGPAGAPLVPGTGPIGGSGVDTSTTTTVVPTTTTTPLLVVRETGGCTGRGYGRLPAMQYVTENPAFGTIDVGDVVTTTGGSTSLAPPDIVVGEVINKVSRAGSAGPLLEIKLGADLTHLNFVQIVLYRPPSEVPGG